MPRILDVLMLPQCGFSGLSVATFAFLHKLQFFTESFCGFGERVYMRGEPRVQTVHDVALRLEVLLFAVQFTDIDVMVGGLVLLDGNLLDLQLVTLVFYFQLKTIYVLLQYFILILHRLHLSLLFQHLSQFVIHPTLALLT